MDIDENDILYTNVFINSPDTKDVSKESSEEFEKYYKQEEARKTALEINEETDNMNLLQTNPYNTINEIDNDTLKSRRVKEIKTYVSVDSRDRNKLIYPKPNSFKIFLGKTFYNVKEIRLANLEFPNTNAVINSNNNKIYWRNQEDIDDDIIDNITKTYSVYNVDLRIGSYIATTLQLEIVNKLSAIKRRNKTGDFHYFGINLDLDTDIVTTTSLILTQLPNNPLSVTSGLGLVTVNAPDHGYSTGMIIYMIGTKTLAGIPSLTLNNPHGIIVLDQNTFQFEVNIKAGETLTGGGNTVQSGKLSPFQLLYGEYPNTIAPNIGYPLENSSQRIDTYIKSIQNFYQVKITTAQPHNFQNTYNWIGQVCVINGSGTSPSIDGNRVITNIIDPTNFLISVNTKIDFNVFGSGQVTFNSVTLDILRIGNNDIDTVLVETFTDHSLEPNNIGDTFTFYNTTTVPLFDGFQTVYSIFSNTLLIFPGQLLPGGDASTLIPNEIGSIPQHNPLLTSTKIITAFTIGVISTITIPNHGLLVGDSIKIYNLITSPPVALVSHKVYSVLDSDNFTINFSTVSHDNDSIEKSNAYIGLQTITISFPDHGFNTITSISSVSEDLNGYNVEISTFLPHNLTTGDTVRIMETNCTPVIDDGKYIVKVIDSDTFEIIVLGGGITGNGTSGILGMSNEFFLYSARSIGGINTREINNIKFRVKDIIDENTFRFDSISFANKTERGGGSNLFISSLRHGFSGIQENTKNSLLNRSINLEGENYVFLCCPQLATMMNTGNVNDIFARITLDQSPGSIVFNYLSNPKTFDTTPLNMLNELEFSIINYDNSLYEFSDLDYSFVLEITEVIDTNDSFNFSSRRGIVS